LDALVDAMAGRRDLPAKAVVITFDDADRTVADLAAPLLARHGMPASVFVVTSKTGLPWEEVEVMTTAELRGLHRSGWIVGSHPHDLHRKVRLPGGDRPLFLALAGGWVEGVDADEGSERVREDLERSRRWLADSVGVDRFFLAWPYGFGDGRVDRIARRAGFEAVCTLRPGPNRWPLDEDSLRGEALEIRRYTVTARTTPRVLRRMLRGEWEAEEIVLTGSP
jgi:biofilm PGA synthesis lipoprotein PgaB